MGRTEAQKAAIQEKLKTEMKDIGGLPLEKRDAAALVAIAVANTDLGSQVHLDMQQELDGRVISYSLRNLTDENEANESRKKRERLRRR